MKDRLFVNTDRKRAAFASTDDIRKNDGGSTTTNIESEFDMRSNWPAIKREYGLE